MQRPIYLDYAATTPIDPRVIEKMLNFMGPQADYGNPASVNHYYGTRARQAVEYAREQVASLINSDSSEICWTSGATEANNLAIIGAARFYQRKGKHIITGMTEHKAVLDTCRNLEKEGFEVTYLQPDGQGLYALDLIRSAMRPDTILLSLMHVNNELGVIQDIHRIGELARERGILFHVDAAQSTGKLLIDLQSLQVDLMSFSAHKIYGPKGIGALYVRKKPKVRLQPLIYGGGHEQGLRSGTLATHQIVGMGEALSIAQQEMEKDRNHLSKLKLRLINGLQPLGEVYLNGHPEYSVPGIVNLSFNHVEGESLLFALHELAVSAGSACTSASIEPSYVLRALGINDELAHSSLRLSLGRYTMEAEIDEAIAIISTQVKRLRDMATLR